jgi:uncharacterized membrane-anchored protein YitT (DUF2179 family)
MFRHSPMTKVFETLQSYPKIIPSYLVYPNFVNTPLVVFSVVFLKKIYVQPTIKTNTCKTIPAGNQKNIPVFDISIFIS